MVKVTVKTFPDKDEDLVLVMFVHPAGALMLFSVKVIELESHCKTLWP